MCDGIPSVVFLVVSFPTNFVKSSPYFSITNLGVKIRGNPHQLPPFSSESIALTHQCASKIHSTPGQSMTWLSSQHLFLSLEPNSYSWLPCFCQLHPSQGSCQMRRVWNYSSYHGLCPPVAQLDAQSLRGIPLPSVAYCLRVLNFKQFFFWPVGRLVTVMQVWESHGVLGQGDIRFLFC